jgi:glutathione S-transferase
MASDAFIGRQWALEETGLPYRVHALDHTAGELASPAFKPDQLFSSGAGYR